MENLDKEIYLELGLKENNGMSNDVLIEKLIYQYKNKKEENERLIECSKAIISEYLEKVELYRFEINNSEEKLKQYISALISNEQMKETKTQYSYKLPSAKIVKNKSKSVIVQGDKDKLLEYVKNNNHDYIKTKTVESVDWAEYKKNLIIVDNEVIDVLSGEVVEDCKVEVKPESIELKIL